MSQFEKSEVMLKYAELMDTSLHKKAWTSRDLVRSLGMEALFAGGAAALGTAGIGSGGTAGAAGAAAALGFGATPIGWIFAGTLLAGSVAAAIYYATRMADDNMRDLKERLEALDYEGTASETIIKSWVEKMNEFETAFDLPPLSGNKEEDALILSDSVRKMEIAMEFLNRMSVRWPEVKKNLTDWENFIFNDPADFEEALTKTTATTKNVISSYRAKAQRAANSIIGDMKDPSKVMREIKQLHEKISTIWAPPVYNDEEKKLLEFGLRLSERKVDLNEFNEYLPLLQDLRDELRDRILPAANKKARGRRANTNNNISRVAVELPDTPSGTPPPEIKQKRPISRNRLSIPKNDAVQEMQNQLNVISVALDIPGTERLIADGRYGPKTASVVAAVINHLSQADPKKYPEQAKIMGDLKRWGITENELGNVQLMNSNPRMMNVLFNSMDNVYQIHTGQKQRPMSKRDVEQQQQQQQQYRMKEETAPSNVWKKQNPSKEEMIYAFKQIYDNIGGTRVNLYDYAKHNLGMSDNDIFNMLYAEFRGSPPKNWVKSTIVDALGSRYGLL